MTEETHVAPGKVKMVTLGSFKSGGQVYGPGSVVAVTTEDLLANPGNFVKVPKVVPVVEEPIGKGKK